MLRTTDGGRTWRDVALPPRGGDGDLTVLPDGSLVMSHSIQYVGRWKLLRPGGHAWCRLTRPSPAVQRLNQLSAPAVIDGELWWLTGPQDHPDAAPALNAAPACGAQLLKRPAAARQRGAYQPPRQSALASRAFTASSRACLRLSSLDWMNENTTMTVGKNSDHAEHDVGDLLVVGLAEPALASVGVGKRRRRERSAGRRRTPSARS